MFLKLFKSKKRKWTATTVTIPVKEVQIKNSYLLKKALERSEQDGPFTATTVTFKEFAAN